MPGEAIVGADVPDTEGVPATVARVLGEGADAFLDAATDKKTTSALDRLGGTELRLGVMVAAMIASGIRVAVRRRFLRRSGGGPPEDPPATTPGGGAADVTS